MPGESRLLPTKIKAPHGATTFEIAWNDATSSRIPHVVLRGYCPCAECQGHQGTIRFVQAADQSLRDIKQVGNYALGLTWGDGHAGGIYTFPYLRHLGDLVDQLGVEALCSLQLLPPVP